MDVWFPAPDGSSQCCECKPNVCDPCSECVCAAPTLVCDSASISLSKCGFPEFGTPSDPPKIYATKTQSGGLTFDYIDGCTYQNAWSGAQVIDKYPCTVLSDDRMISVTESGLICENCTTNVALGVDDVTEPGPPEAFAGCGRWAPNPSCASGTIAALDYCCDDGTNASTTVKTYAEPGCGFPNSTGSTVTLTLSNDYTTAELVSNAQTHFPSYPGTFDGNCSAFQIFSSDEITYSEQRFYYKFILPDLTGCTSYFILWRVGPTGDLMEYSWNGSDTETPTYGPVISSPGATIGVQDIVYFC